MQNAIRLILGYSRDAGLQIRRGNRDNLGIISQTSP